MRYKTENREGLVQGVRHGDIRCASRLMSLLENGEELGEECLKLLPYHTRIAHVIGVTGWPGVGKSTLVSRIASAFLRQSKKVGIIAIDPTSPFSGGSFLGDRERMKTIEGDDRLFIRSMATRGHTGGIGGATGAFVRVMEALGKEIIIVETVGVGQDQVSVSRVADTIIVTAIPGMGDYIQALKAGVLEAGDIFVVNKADRAGADDVIMNLKMVIAMSGRQEGWKPPIVKTCALTGQGIDLLITEIGRHREYMNEHGRRDARMLAAVRWDILEVLKSKALMRIASRVALDERLDTAAQEVCSGAADPYTAADAILKESGFMNEGGSR